MYWKNFLMEILMLSWHQLWLQRIKQVVHHATKLNEAISAVRGVPMTRAHITYGGYYDGL